MVTLFTRVQIADVSRLHGQSRGHQLDLVMYCTFARLPVDRSRQQDSRPPQTLTTRDLSSLSMCFEDVPSRRFYDVLYCSIVSYGSLKTRGHSTSEQRICHLSLDLIRDGGWWYRTTPNPKLVLYWQRTVQMISSVRYPCEKLWDGVEVKPCVLHAPESVNVPYRPTLPKRSGRRQGIFLAPHRPTLTKRSGRRQGTYLA